AEQTAAASWSVRELERRRTLLAASPPSRSTVARDPDLVRLEERLRERLAAPVRLRYDAARGYGRIEISFSSLEECDGILSTIGINKADK
ncbi:MAG: chromosome partitioning protein ParB, partial [Candidatus Competibacter sp.]